MWRRKPAFNKESDAEVDEEERELFDPSFTTVERVLASRSFSSVPKPLGFRARGDASGSDADGADAGGSNEPPVKLTEEQQHMADLYQLAPEAQLARLEEDARPRKQQLEALRKRKAELETEHAQLNAQYTASIAGIAQKQAAVQDALRVAQAAVQRNEPTERRCMEEVQMLDQQAKTVATQVQARAKDIEGEFLTVSNDIMRLESSNLPTMAREAFLVKWAGLSYKDATWEWREDIDDDLKTSQFLRRNVPPSQVKQVESAAVVVEPSPHVATRSVPIPANSDVRRNIDRAMFNRAQVAYRVVQVCEALRDYVGQAEASGLLQVGDEILCINGTRVEGHFPATVASFIQKETEHRTLRMLRRSAAVTQLEVRFDASQPLGVVLGRPEHIAEGWTVRPSTAIAAFLTPKEYAAARPSLAEHELEAAAAPHNVTACLRAAVIRVFQARAPRLDVATAAAEARVSEDWLRRWLSQAEFLRDANETLLMRWVKRCTNAFAQPSSVPLEAIEALMRSNDELYVPLHDDEEEDESSVDAVARNSLRTSLALAYKVAVDKALPFADEARRQALDPDPWKSLGLHVPTPEDLYYGHYLVPLSATVSAAKTTPQTSFHTMQLRAISALQTKRFEPYTEENPMRFKNQHELRSYQREGVNWLVRQWYTGRNCILADEMGLGKTVQVVGLVEHLRTVESLRGPYLIVAPLSTMGHWRREFEGWTEANVCYYYDTVGGAPGRELIRKYEWFYDALPGRTDVCKFNVMLTTYETFVADSEYLSKLPFLSVVVDEGHRLKSQQSRLLNELRKLKCRHRLLLSGTPLQNDLKELWSLLNFIEPEDFHSQEAFLRKHGQLQSAADVATLQRAIAPYMLRRVKEDVEKAIPAKEETIFDVELTMYQKAYYRAVFDRNRDFLNLGAQSSKHKPQLINVEMELRKCCNHPYLMEGVREGDHTFTRQEAVDRLVRASGKMVLVDKLLAKLKREGRKALIFSQFVRMLDLLGELCEARGYGFERIDGSIRGNVRQAAIDRFGKPDSSSFVFLLSTKAGGVGINLTAADTVIIYDSDWNPQNDAQAQARAHRIGQDKMVSVYRLVTKHTYEETMLDRASKKLGLEQAVLGEAAMGVGGKSLDPQELERMLRLGAYHHLSKQDDDVADEQAFYAADIETLLAKNTRKVTVDGIRGTVSLQLTHDTAPAGGTTTTTTTTTTAASSSSAAGAAARSKPIQVDDPDFWQKVLPKVDTADTLLSKLNETAGTAELRNNKEARAGFVRRLKELVDEILALRSTGTVVDAHRMDTTIALLVQASDMNNTFGRAACDDFEAWRQSIEASKERRSRVRGRESLVASAGDDAAIAAETDGRRKRNKRSSAKAARGGGGGDDDDDEEDDDDDDGAAGASRGKEAAVLPLDFFTEVCATCSDGGPLLLCDGRCERAFHPTCLAHEPPADESQVWECDDCASKQHACELCGKRGSETTTLDAVYKCDVTGCGRFFHLECAAKDSRAQATTTGFSCPVHRCARCHVGGPEVTVQCLRCPKGFHHACLQHQLTKRLSANLVVCQGGVCLGAARGAVLN